MYKGTNANARGADGLLLLLVPLFPPPQPHPPSPAASIPAWRLKPSQHSLHGRSRVKLGTVLDLRVKILLEGLR